MITNPEIEETTGMHISETLRADVVKAIEGHLIAGKPADETIVVTEGALWVTRGEIAPPGHHSLGHVVYNDITYVVHFALA